MSDDLLAAYDEHLRGTGLPALGAWVEQDGPLLRVVGEHRGFVTGPRDLSGYDLGALIAAQIAFFGARGEAVEWKTRGHDLPEDLPDRLRAAGFAAEPTETVMIGRTADLRPRAGRTGPCGDPPGRRRCHPGHRGYGVAGVGARLCLHR